MMRFCSRCGAVADGKCNKCKPAKRKQTTKQAGYGSDWKRMSERIRAQRPLCEDCLQRGRVRPSTECHHIVTINEDRGQRMNPNNVVALCKQCHDERHRLAP